MGQKTHPIGFRLGTTRLGSHWFGVNQGLQSSSFRRS